MHIDRSRVSRAIINLVPNLNKILDIFITDRLSISTWIRVRAFTGVPMAIFGTPKNPFPS